MWPKALAQLIELAPHITRLVPLADRFFKGKSTEQEATRHAMQQMADGLHDDLGSHLGQVTASHAGIYRQLNDQSEKLSTLSTDLRSAKIATEANEAQLALLQEELRLVRVQLAIGLLLLLALLVVVVSLYTRHS